MWLWQHQVFGEEEKEACRQPKHPWKVPGVGAKAVSPASQVGSWLSHCPTDLTEHTRREALTGEKAPHERAPMEPGFNVALVWYTE